MELEYVLPSEIEKRSFEIIEEELKNRNIILPEQEKPVTMRVIHTSADFDYAESIKRCLNALEERFTVLWLMKMFQKRQRNVH